MGAEAVLEQDVYVRRVPKAGKRSICRSGCIQVWKAFRARYRQFGVEYRDAFFDLRLALKLGHSLESVCFPCGGVLPGGWIPT